jgi:hypothetical protein
MVEDDLEMDPLKCSVCGKEDEDVMAIDIKPGKDPRAICYDCWNAK